MKRTYNTEKKPRKEAESQKEEKHRSDETGWLDVSPLFGGDLTGCRAIPSPPEWNSLSFTSPLRLTVNKPSNARKCQM